MVRVLIFTWMLCSPLLLAAQDEKKPAEPVKPVPQEEPKAPADKPQEPPDESLPEDRQDSEIQVGLRVGGWRSGSFNALTPGGQRTIVPTLMFDAGFDARVLWSGWSLTLAADYGSSRSFTMETIGLLVGVDLDLEAGVLPVDLQIAVGPLLGRLDVTVAGFGSFNHAVGIDARIAATGWLNTRIGLNLWLEYRDLSFKYAGTVTSGDTSAGGPSYAFGLGLLMRF